MTNGIRRHLQKIEYFFNVSTVSIKPNDNNNTNYEQKMSGAAAPSPRVYRNLLGSVQPAIINKDINDVVNPDYFNSILLRPRYQRPIAWRLEDMNGFIGTIMKNGFVFPILMYKLHPEDKV